MIRYFKLNLFTPSGTSCGQGSSSLCALQVAAPVPRPPRVYRLGHTILHLKGKSPWIGAGPVPAAFPGSG